MDPGALSRVLNLIELLLADHGFPKKGRPLLDRADWTTFIPSPTDFSFLVFLSALLNIFGFRYKNFDDHWLALRHERTLTARQSGEE